MEFTFNESAGSKQLGLSVEDLEFFQKIKKKNIPLNLELNGKVTEDVLRNKRIDTKCPDITKLGKLSREFSGGGCKNKTIKVKKITIEFECI